MKRSFLLAMAAISPAMAACGGATTATPGGPTTASPSAPATAAGELELREVFDVLYQEDRDGRQHALSVYAPATESGPWPVAVMIHGAGGPRLDHWARDVARQGVVAFVPTWSDNGPWPSAKAFRADVTAITEQLACAVGFAPGGVRTLRGRSREPVALRALRWGQFRLRDRGSPAPGRRKDAWSARAHRLPACQDRVGDDLQSRSSRTTSCSSRANWLFMGDPSLEDKPAAGRPLGDRRNHAVGRTWMGRTGSPSTRFGMTPACTGARRARIGGAPPVWGGCRAWGTRRRGGAEDGDVGWVRERKPQPG